ncbi:MAG: hypothetical protein ACLP9L_23325 [Thermoguttaceae bacterium]
MKTRIMYIEKKGDGISGPARIGRVTFSKSGKSLYYQGRRFQTLAGQGFKANYFDVATGEEYWISGCKKDGTDRLYSGVTEIDEDVAEEYWREIRGKSERASERHLQRSGKYSI